MNAIPMEVTYEVRFYETDALQHVSNISVVTWFEAARDNIFRFFNPDLSLAKWNLILANYNVNFHRQMYFGSPVTIKTYISRLGSASFDVYQEVWQKEQKCASGVTTLVHFDFTTQQSVPITEAVREKLLGHFIELDKVK